VVVVVGGIYLIHGSWEGKKMALRQKGKYHEERRVS
jgi:hypothetical protein